MTNGIIRPVTELRYGGGACTVLLRRPFPKTREKIGPPEVSSSDALSMNQARKEGKCFITIKYNMIFISIIRAGNLAPYTILLKSTQSDMVFENSSTVRLMKTAFMPEMAVCTCRPLAIAREFSRLAFLKLFPLVILALVSHATRCLRRFSARFPRGI